MYNNVQTLRNMIYFIFNFFICVQGVPDAVQLMTYGPDLGHDDYRETLAEFLKRHYKTPVDK